jgi:chaperone modulatory protein CbpM
MQTLSGILLEDDYQVSLAELCRACSIHADWLIDLVNEGIVEPSGTNVADWRFSSVEIVRVHTVIRLQQDLQVNLAGAALALELLDEIDNLRARLRALDHSA